MDREQWNRIKHLHFAASELPPEEREGFLAGQCADSEERAEVRRLLAADAPTDFLREPVLGERLAVPELQAGAKLGRYEIQALLGQGGGGRVYRALDPSLRRQVALKVLPPALMGDVPVRRRFLREAVTASALNHPNIVTVYEVGTDNGIDFIAMEYIAGKTLRDAIAKNGLPAERFYPWAIEIAGALTAAHEAGVVHRDLKPGNVMISPRGSVKVLDFGLAKAMQADTSSDTVSAEGMVVGTCAYMAPEQAEGKPVDARADIFSFGCVLYEMATGRPAFSGDSAISILGSVLHREPPSVRAAAPGLPQDLDRLITQCLKKEAGARWQSVADLRFLLEQLRQDVETSQAAEQGRARRTWWKLLAAAMAGALLAAVPAAWYALRTPRAGPEYRTLALTLDPGLSTGPSLSADGRMVAYASDRAGNGDLDVWVQQIGGQEPIRLTQDPADEKDPDLSADGTRVVFRSEKDGGGIYVVPALGGQPVLLAQGGRNPRFSPDGKWVAYWSGREGSSLVSGSAQAYVIPAGGGQPSPLGAGLVASCYPVWSPTGDRVLLVGRRNPDPAAERAPEWWVTPVAGGASSATGAQRLLWAPDLPLLVPYSQYWFLPLAWSPAGGGQVIFEARSGDTSNLWALPLSTRTKRVWGAPTRLTGGVGAESFAAVSSTGAIAYASTTLRVDLWSLDLEADGGATRAEPQRITADLSWKFFPSLSWDDSKAAYVARRGGAYSLCVRDLKGGGESTIMTSADPMLSPRLSGDGNWIALADADGSVSRIATRGGATASLCMKCGSPVDVSGDGGSVVLEPNDRDEVRVLDAATGTVSTVVPERERLYSGRFSRDRRWVVFDAMVPASATSQIFVARVVDGKAEPPQRWIPITGTEAANQGPEWAASGNAIYFRSERDGFRCVWMRRLNPATKEPEGQAEALLHFHHARRSLQHIAGFDDRTRLAVGGRKLLVVVGELTGNVWMRTPRKP